jgi:hypothetical protein
MISKERELLSRLSNAMESGGALERAREALRQFYAQSVPAAAANDNSVSLVMRKRSSPRTNQAIGRRA